MNELKISVVTGTYNRSQRVKNMVLKAWDQSVKPYEIIVSDDNSTDDTLTVLKTLQKSIPVLKIIKNKLNSGGVPNWNKAINSASGDVIAWCSDDDEFEYEHLENSINKLKEDDSIDLIHSSFINVENFNDKFVYEKTKLKSDSEIIITKENVIKYLQVNYNWPFHPSTLVFRKKLWNEVGQFDPNYELADTDWFIRVAMSSKICYLPVYGVKNYRHQGNWSNDVGSVGMQNEFKNSLTNFYNNQFDLGLDLTKQYKSWMRHYRLILLRIWISRSRAGYFDVAKLSIKSLLHSYSLRSTTKNFLTLLFNNFSILLFFIQKINIFRLNKYDNLGKSSPK